MSPQLKTAILEFLANEFQKDPGQLALDTNFRLDFGLDESGVGDLLQRLQDSLNFILPEAPLQPIETIADLFAALEENPETESGT